MKAVQLRHPGGLDNLTVVNLPDPGEPKADQIRVRIHASSLNYHDLGVATGSMPTEDLRIVMADGAGIVEAVGPGVSEFRPGDHVVSTFFPQWLNGEPTDSTFSTVPGDGQDGFASEIVVRDAKAFTLAPAGYTHTEAATLTTAGLTAWRALIVNGQLKPGETVLVLGTGGVSVFAIQIAKSAGAKVIATSSSDEKLQRAKDLGADFLINYTEHPRWSEKVLEFTGGKGVDHVIEVGGPGTLPQSMLSCRVAGHISMIGVLTGSGGNIDTSAIVVKQLNVKGLIVGNRNQQQDFVAAINATGIKPVIDSVYPLEQIAEAFQKQKQGKHFGKICLSF